MIEKIVSGGQTGADQAGLDAAIEAGIPHGGWVPRGRRTEAGRLGDRYDMREDSSAHYPGRTRKNVMDSDGTLIVSHGRLTGGSALTRTLAEKHGKPFLHVNLSKVEQDAAAGVVAGWIREKKIKVLNVAGPRASEDPDIYDDTKRLLKLAIESAHAVAEASE